jgi:hypothetical protein
MSNCYAVGLWVWAEFQQKPNDEQLSLLKEKSDKTLVASKHGHQPVIPE